MKTRILFIVSLFTLAFLGLAFQDAPKPWVVPDAYAKKVNPIKTSSASISAGKALFVKHCQDCHGKKGLGDGTKVPDLKTTPADMTKAVFQSQSDGAIFYKLSEGRNEMPRGKKDLPDEDDRWNLVNYLRTFGSGK